MSQDISRRGLLGTAGAVAAGASLGVFATGARADSAVPAPGGPADPGAQLRVLPGDGRYQALSQGFNQRWTSEPRYIQLITADAEAVATVNGALRQGLRPTVRSGGHCYEDFVENTGGAILDLSLRKGVGRGRDKYGRTAYCVEAGASLWDVYTELFRKYDVAIPGGSCYSVGAGGHICGGGYGVLNRRDGLTVDHLVQVDVVTVKDGRAEITSAHRDDPEGSDTAHLFWAHTGGGGGNFGVVLRYWFTEQLPTPPPRVWLSSIAWPWADLLKNPDDFPRLLANYGEFFAAHSSPDEQVYQDLFSILKLTHKTNGNIALFTEWVRDDVGPLDDFLRAMQAGLTTEATVQTTGAGGLFLPLPEKRRQMPWMEATMTLNGSGANQRGKYKSAYHRKPFSAGNVTGIWNWLTRDDPGVDLTQTLVQIDSYGCRTNAVDPCATAVPQRDSFMKLQYQTYWTSPAQDQAHLDFLSGFYREVYAETGGVPEISDAGHDLGTDGAYVNYPDVDLGTTADPAPLYPRLYYKQNYPRLQLAKSIWDRENVFHHKQSVTAAGSTPGG
ncbi:BBE domain-containing protein [Kitasatospora sp. NBC_00240]|uniref:BBE domain-containing protein n=1 Tax=Kitasatospora sp. NBC_00240 TaxID=2903567 RepID=UPI00224CC218|nr:BBE domain-containing protein [Kitasatospora sp. NBC_00240]MCX5213755.1 BBE domain-containing protein [Kitasatospora sp. NBC_00240]